MTQTDPLCALGAPTPACARLTRLQRTQINRQAHVNAQAFERLERERLTRETIERIEAAGSIETSKPAPSRTALDPLYA